MSSRRVDLLGLLIVLGLAASAAAREWRDSTGEYSREADFVALQDGRVYLKLSSGPNASIALNQLSDADQEFVAVQMRRTAYDPFQVATDADSATAQTVYKPNVESLPVQTAAFAALEQMSTQTLNLQVDTSKVRKYVYYGCRSTTHLLDFGPQSGVGTIHYSLCHHHPPSCCGCRWTLALLLKHKQTSTHFWYQPLFADPTIDMWAFSRHPHGCDQYGIWYRVAQTGQWRRFDTASRVRPR